MKKFTKVLAIISGITVIAITIAAVITAIRKSPTEAKNAAKEAAKKSLQKKVMAVVNRGDYATFNAGLKTQSKYCSVKEFNHELKKLNKRNASKTLMRESELQRRVTELEAQLERARMIEKSLRADLEVPSRSLKEVRVENLNLSTELKKLKMVEKSLRDDLEGTCNTLREVMSKK